MLAEDRGIKELLKQNLEINEESLDILKKMRRAQITGRVFKIIYWLVIIAGVLGAYYYVQPILNNFLDVWQKVSTDVSNLRDTTTKSLNINGVNPGAVPSGLLDRIQRLFKK
ncbi:MAG: hypothetical protein Q7R75_00140 [bacterium]|nr:hypothetical protein [bacterium]